MERIDRPVMLALADSFRVLRGNGVLPRHNYDRGILEWPTPRELAQQAVGYQRPAGKSDYAITDDERNHNAESSLSGQDPTCRRDGRLATASHGSARRAQLKSTRGIDIETWAQHWPE